MKEERGPLNAVREEKLVNLINRAHLILHSTLLSLFLYHRLISLLRNDAVSAPPLLLFLAELVLSLFWLSEQAFRWRIVHRAVFPHRLPHHDLPPLDVFVCTADPDREPTFEVMNTLVSAMALDYPIDKLHVYLSDDAGSHFTLAAINEAWAFATWWLPFCNRYAVQCRCPMAYFDETADPNTTTTCEDDYVRDKLLIKEKYELFNKRVEDNRRVKLRPHTDNSCRTNHPPIVQVINEDSTHSSLMNPDYNGGVPLLVYVSREKRPSHPHHFKAGALNVLLRVSGMLSNSPIVLMLDCDMYCNDPTSAKQAMCFFMDTKISASLGFVQFPQRFHNLSKHPIYDDDFRWAFKVLLRGMDGVGSGPSMCGTGCYMKRDALFNACVNGLDPIELRKTFGPSNEHISTTSQPNGSTAGIISQKIQKEVEFLSTCSYEEETKWGDGLGFYYYSVAEDVFTGYNIHMRGWKSIYMDPEKAAFLGSSTTNLNDLLTQSSRWTAGLAEIGLSRYCPWTYGPSRTHLSLLHRTCYAWVDINYICFISVWCFAVVPQLCLLHGIPIYSKVSSSLFPLLASTIFISSQTKHLHEVLTTGGTIASWWAEQQTWVIKMFTSYAYGCIDATMKILGLKNTSFIPTNKVVDEDQATRYHQGIYDFQTSSMFLVPIGTFVLLNSICFIGGLARMIMVGNWDEMALQEVLSGFFLVMSKPVIEGMIVRKDKGKFPRSDAFKSLGVCFMLIVLAPVILLI